MKSVLMYITLLVSSSFSYATVRICQEPAQQNCIEITKISDDMGSTWSNACCQMFDFIEHEYCWDNCHYDLESNSVEKSYYEDTWIDELEWKHDAQNYIIEFRENGLFLNNKLLTKPNNNINAIILRHPNFSKNIRLKKSGFKKFEDVKHFYSYIKPKVRLGVQISPNRIIAGDEFTIKYRSKPTNIALFSVKGEVQPINIRALEMKMAIIETSSVLVPGIYFVKLEFSKGELVLEKIYVYAN